MAFTNLSMCSYRKDEVAPLVCKIKCVKYGGICTRPEKEECHYLSLEEIEERKVNIFKGSR